jgi:hypothetical protein
MQRIVNRMPTVIGLPFVLRAMLAIMSHQRWLIFNVAAFLAQPALLSGENTDLAARWYPNFQLVHDVELFQCVQFLLIGK